MRLHFTPWWAAVRTTPPAVKMQLLAAVLGMEALQPTRPLAAVAEIQMTDLVRRLAAVKEITPAEITRPLRAASRMLPVAMAVSPRANTPQPTMTMLFSGAMARAPACLRGETHFPSWP